MITAALDAVANRKKDKPEPSAEQKLAAELVARAREQGVSLTGPEGLLKQRRGHRAHRRKVADLHGQPVAGNVRNGTRPKAVLTEASGQVGIEVPRDRSGHVRAADR